VSTVPSEGRKKTGAGGRQGAMAHAANTVVVMASLLAGGSAAAGAWGELARGEALLTGFCAVLVTMMIGGFAAGAVCRSPAQRQ
jgi:hypothetical protein